MKILLINPPWSDIYGSYKKAAVLSKTTPSGLMYLASYLIKYGGYDVNIIDAEAEMLSYNEIQQKIEDLSPNIVGVTATTPLFPKAKKIANIAKKIDKGIKVVVGGPHVSALAKESLDDCTDIDMVVIGEGEVTFYELVKAIENGENESELYAIKGIGFRDKKGAVLTQNREPISDLDSLPFPARSLVKNELYRYSALIKDEKKMTTIQTTRGCPFKCIFCYPMFGRNVRFRSAKSIINEVEDAVNNFGIEFIYFVDDTMTINKKRMFDICNGFIEKGLNNKVKWFCTTRVDTVDKELLSKMKKSGCIRVNFGVESGNSEILKIIKKGITVEQVILAFQDAKDIGLEAVAYFIIGHPHETKDTIKDTIKLAKKIDPSHAEFSIMTPFPGTELYKMIQKNEAGMKIKITDWNNYAHYGNVVIELDDISSKELLKFQKQAFRQFYLRPKKILEILKKTTIKNIIKSGYAFLKSQRD